MKSNSTLLIHKVVILLGVLFCSSLNSIAQHVDLQQVMNLEGHHWTDKVSGRLSGSVDIPKFIGHPSSNLLAIDYEINEFLHNRDMSQRDFFRFKDRIDTYSREHPNELAQCFILLGNLYRFARPVELRNLDRAQTCYLNAIELLPESDNKSRGELYYMIANSYTYETQNANLGNMARYLREAIDYQPQLCSALGDLYLCGWGVYQDIYMAASLYDIARLFGDSHCYTSTRVVQYLVEHPFKDVRDSLAYDDFMHFFYYQVVQPDNTKAMANLRQSANKGFVPAYCVLAGILHDQAYHVTDVASRDQLRQASFEWYRRGVQADYSPAKVEMAQICMEWNVDTAKGFIYTPDKNGNYRDKDRIACRKQALALLTDCAKHDNIKAMRLLGELYYYGGELGIPAQDKEAGLFWYSDAARRSDYEAEQMLQVLYESGAISAAKIEELGRLTNSEMEKETKYNMHIFSSINKDKRFKDFNFGEMSLAREYAEMCMLNINQDPLLNFRLIKDYKTLYEYYERILTQIAERSYKRPTTGHAEVEYCKYRMRDLRERLDSFNITTPTHPSFMESYEWDGSK